MLLAAAVSLDPSDWCICYLLPSRPVLQRLPKERKALSGCASCPCHGECLCLPSEHPPDVSLTFPRGSSNFLLAISGFLLRGFTCCLCSWLAILSSAGLLFQTGSKDLLELQVRPETPGSSGVFLAQTDLVTWRPPGVSVCLHWPVPPFLFLSLERLFSQTAWARTIGVSPYSWLVSFLVNPNFSALPSIRSV